MMDTGYTLPRVAHWAVMARSKVIERVYKRFLFQNGNVAARNRVRV